MLTATRRNRDSRHYKGWSKSNTDKSSRNRSHINYTKNRNRISSSNSNSTIEMERVERTIL